ncbi:MAG TPA: hypothetical protein VF041_10515 [Gemmatimonadaceae bacterium]
MAEARTNPDGTPRSRIEDEPVRYPENSVVGIIGDVNDLGSAVTALTSGGFLRSEIDVAYGRGAADKLAGSTGRTGLSGLALRLARRIGMPDDELAAKDRYTDALRDGRFVVVVLAPTEERRELAARVLREHGAEFVNFLGRFTIETMSG